MQKKILFLCFLAPLFACAKAPPKTALDVARIRDLDRQLLALEQVQDANRTVQGYAQVKVAASGASDVFDAAVLAKSPNRLLVQILDELGQEKARLVADGQRVLFFNAERNRYFELPQDEAALRKTLKLPISVEEFLDRLLRRWQATGTRAWSESASTRVAYWSEGSGARLGFSAAPLKLVVYEALTPRGKPRYRVEYGERSMDWFFRRPKLRLSLHFLEWDTPHDISDRRFDASPPPAAVPEPP